MKKALWGILVLDLAAVNLILGYVLYTGRSAGPAVETVTRDTEATVTDGCREECRAYVDQKLANLTFPTTAPIPTQVIIRTGGTTVREKVRTVQYVTVPGSGSTRANDWENLAATEFYLDTRDYPGLVEIYFEANMKLFNGNGAAYARLFDATHKIGVQGSEVSTTSQTDAVVTSGQVTFWAGKNLVRVQAKSLTADTTVYNWGRLRIVTEN